MTKKQKNGHPMTNKMSFGEGLKKSDCEEYEAQALYSKEKELDKLRKMRTCVLCVLFAHFSSFFFSLFSFSFVSLLYASNPWSIDRDERSLIYCRAGRSKWVSMRVTRFSIVAELLSRKPIASLRLFLIDLISRLICLIGCICLSIR